MTCRDCGRPVDECLDPERVHYPFRRICYATMEREAAGAMYAELHKDQPYHDGTFTSWAKDRSLEHPYHFNEGVSISVADHDIAPWDNFTTEVSASPVAPASSDSWAPTARPATSRSVSASRGCR